MGFYRHYGQLRNLIILDMNFRNYGLQQPPLIRSGQEHPFLEWCQDLSQLLYGNAVRLIGKTVELLIAESFIHYDLSKPSIPFNSTGQIFEVGIKHSFPLFLELFTHAL